MHKGHCMPCLLSSVSILCFFLPTPALIRLNYSLCLTSHMFQWLQAWRTVIQSPPGCPNASQAILAWSFCGQCYSWASISRCRSTSFNRGCLFAEAGSTPFVHTLAV